MHVHDGVPSLDIRTRYRSPNAVATPAIKDSAIDA
jgi:hypothetical protein